jgi:hypothetical protein
MTIVLNLLTIVMVLFTVLLLGYVIWIFLGVGKWR